MDPTSSLRAYTRCIGAAAIAIHIWSLAPAHAENAADAIAGKFAADGEAAARSKADNSQDQWVKEEARRAIERALAQEGERGDAARQALDGKGTSAREPQPETVQSAEEDVPAGPAAEPVNTAPDDAKALEVEGEELADKLRQLRRKREAGRPAFDAEHGAIKNKEPGLVEKAISGLASQVSGYVSPLVEKRVSILIVMDVGKKGVRSWSKTADPMLCIHQSCYLSRGPDKAAEKLSRSAAFGPGVALGKRGLACRSSPKCIFRNIDLETVEAKLQPVDLRFLRHDRREAKAIRADATCAIVEGKLSCLSPAVGEGWRAWIVPESIAQKAGGDGLEAALGEGLR